MNAKISEKIKIDVEQMALTTVSQGSIAYDMQNYDRALFVASIYSTLGVSSQVVDLWETSAATVTGTTSTALKTGVEIGSTNTTAIVATRGCREMLITLGTAATDLSPLTITYGTVSRTFVNTTSTALHNSSAWTTAALYFGSTVGSTVDTGLQLSAGSLKTAIESTKGFSGVLQCSTPSTVQLVVKVASEGTASLGFTSTSAAAAGLAQRCVVGFDIAAEDLTSTAGKRYVGVNFAAGANAGQKSVVVIREGGRQLPPAFSGLMSS